MKTLLSLEANCICRTRDGLQCPTLMPEADNDALVILRSLSPSPYGPSSTGPDFRRYELMSAATDGQLPVYWEV